MGKGGNYLTERKESVQKLSWDATVVIMNPKVSRTLINVNKEWFEYFIRT